MQNIMASGSVRLNARFWSDENLKINKHKLSQQGQISYPTVLKYLNTPSDVLAFDGGVLYTILVDGMGYSPEEAKKLNLGDVFDFVPEVSQ
jgi:hypothetical protein